MAVSIAKSPLQKDPIPDHADANHHLWRNGRLWWIAFTVHRGCRQDRIRHSLGTADLAIARERRDEVLARIADDVNVRVSLRFPRPLRSVSSRRGA